jgi:WD40 repeat protein
MIKLQTLKEHTNLVWCLTVFNGYLYSGSYDSTIIKWNNDGTINQTLKDHTYSIEWLTVFNGHLYSGSVDRTIIKWNKDGTINQTLKGHTNSVYCLTECNGNLYSASRDKTMIKWGEFKLSDYHCLTFEEKTLLFETSKVLHIYRICKDVRLLIYRYLL